MRNSIIIDITPGLSQPVLYYSQNDVGRELPIIVKGMDIPAGATVTLRATKPSGFGFIAENPVISGNTVTFTTTEDMTDECGRFPAELNIESGDVSIGTANFIMVGEENPHPEGTTDGQSESAIPTLTLLVERIETAAESIHDLNVVAQTLAYNADATATYNEETNTITFGIPQGEAGAGAAGVVASAYSASKTYAVGEYAIHNSNLYRCTTAITTAEAWTSGHWTQVALAPEVSDLKSELNAVDALAGFNYIPDRYVGANGMIGLNDGYRMTHLIPCKGFSSAKVICNSNNINTCGVAFYKQDKSFKSGLSNFGEQGTLLTISIPDDAYYLRLTVRYNLQGYVEFSETALCNIADNLYLLENDEERTEKEFIGAKPENYKGGNVVTLEHMTYKDRMAKKFTPFEYPEGFNGTYKPVNIFTDGENYITDFDPEKFKNSGGNVFYASPTGASANAGTKGAPKSVYSAINGASDNDTIYLLPGVYQNDIISGILNNVSVFNKSINIIGIGDVRLLFGGYYFDNGGEYDSTNSLWRYLLNGCTHVVDANLKYRLPVASSLSDCKNKPGTYWYDSTSHYVYINSPKKPDVYVFQDQYGITIKPTTDGEKIYFENIKFVGGIYNIMVDKPDFGMVETIWYNCQFLFERGQYNGFRMNSGHSLCVQCRVAYGCRDGFGYTPGASTNEMQFVEIDCIGDNNGLFGNAETDNCNGSTCHSGTKGIRVNGLYFNNYGGNIADVQDGTQTINLGCVAKDSGGLSTSMNQGITAQQSGAEMWAYNCIAQGNTFDVYVASGATMHLINTIYDVGGLNGTVTQTGGKQIPINGDLNDYKTPGEYLYSDDDVSGLSHCPATARFTLEVVPNGYYVMQVIYTATDMFVRRSSYNSAASGGYGWRTWYKLTGTQVN